VGALYALALSFFYSERLADGLLIVLIFIFVSQFAFSGAFANVSYVDMVGKSIHGPQRKAFISAKQIVFSIGLFISAVAARQLLTSLRFPDNYAMLFLLAATLLLIASLGFWRLREAPGLRQPRQSLLKFFTLIPSSVRSDKNLRYYLLLINSLGVGLSVLPFIIYMAKESFEFPARSSGIFSCSKPWACSRPALSCFACPGGSSTGISC
jgi:hypothetical protein